MEPSPARLSLRTFAVTYPGTPDQIRQVRVDLRGVLGDCPIAADVTLCASELAANAVRHSRSRYPGGTFTVRAEISPGAYVRIEVEDDGGPWIEPSAGQDRGRGLDIIRALAGDWATYASTGHRIVSVRLTWPDGA